MEGCRHSHIVLVTERPEDEKGNTQIAKTLVECYDCREHLPIMIITKEERIVPIIKIKP